MQQPSDHLMGNCACACRFDCLRAKNHGEHSRQQQPAAACWLGTGNRQIACRLAGRLMGKQLLHPIHHGAWKCIAGSQGAVRPLRIGAPMLVGALMCGWPATRRSRRAGGP